jgi:hypothetical protein
MLRSIAVIGLALPSLLACARSPTAALAPARAPEPPPMTISYRVVRSAGTEGVLLSGRTEIDGHHDVRMHTTAPHHAAFEDLELSTRPADDGSILVSLRYEERSADGVEIDWRPWVRVARGIPARVEVTGPEWGRAIDLTVE